ncbi:hypothetical protein SUGI_1198520 [Cryptomeria japonica]|nr:hypothetical protein SUGI_1198520 [Cryptomeria japonica]
MRRRKRDVSGIVMGPTSTQVCIDYTGCEQDKDMKAGMEEDVMGCSGVLLAERRGKPHPEQALKCPRCDSANTKFCYYNNYSLSQPRYFCKTCRRYWTKGGTLRNVPVGGGCRKNKRAKRTSDEGSSMSTVTDHTSNEFSRLLEKDINNPSISGSMFFGNDMNAAFARIQEAARLGVEDSAFTSSNTADFLGVSYDGMHPMKSTGFSGMEFLKSLRRIDGDVGDVNCLLDPQLGGLSNLAPFTGMNSFYPWRSHEQEHKFEAPAKDLDAGSMLMNLEAQTAENSVKQPKLELLTGLGFGQGKEWQDQLQASYPTARNSAYWNNGGAGAWPYYTSSSVSSLN